MEFAIQSDTSVHRASGESSLTIEHAIPILIFISSFIYLCAFLRYSSLEPDEGILLQGAQRILDGQIPYRDFFTFYTPGCFYLLAGLFKLFGNSFLVARLSIAITGAACSLLVYSLARRVCSRGFALFSAALTAMAGVAYRFLALHNWYSTLLALLALYSLVRFLETRRPAWAFTLGWISALTLLFEQSKGAGLYIGLALAFFGLRFLRSNIVFSSSSLLSFGFGSILPALVTFAYFGFHHSLRVMFADWLWPLQHYARSNHVMYGYQNWSQHTRALIFHSGPLWARSLKIIAISPGFVVPAIPLVVIGLLIYWIIEGRRNRLATQATAYYVPVCSVLGGLFLSVLIVRADIIHFMYLAPFWYIVLAWITEARAFRSHTFRVVSPVLVCCVGVAFGLMSLVLLLTANGANNIVHTRRGTIKTGSTNKVIDWIQSQTTPGEQILVYPYLPLYYYLTETRSPARVDYFQPGMNTPEQAQQIINSLESQNVRVVLFEPAFAKKIPTSWPETPISAIADDPVARYVAQNYRVCETVLSGENSGFEAMVPRQGVCPKQSGQ